jgi:acyl dehydratase
MQAKHSLEFARAPAVWSMYPGILVSRKPSLVPEGGAVPRIQARLSRVNIDRRHLASYAELCGASAGATLPIAYPHILAMPLHLAMLSAEAFPVKLFGLVHVQNRIAMRQPLSADEPAEIRAWIEGHRETERGQEFDLHTEYVVAGEPLWDETCTFLARRRPPATPGSSSRPPARAADGPPEGSPVETSSFRAPAGLGRRYGFISGDVNPIHMSDLTARAFGFPRAIAHGMWSLGRLASDFEAARFDGGCELAVTFKLPIYMPSWLTLLRWPVEHGSGFTLRDAQGEKPHVTGTLMSLR